jgi:Asp-tRNA(Asn)/Glu-tRNA(Gln) amidotransferase A subunit family amidase
MGVQDFGEVYGMARPSFRRRRIAGGSGGGMGMDIAVERAHPNVAIVAFANKLARIA